MSAIPHTHHPLPPAPEPRRAPLGPLGALWVLRKNPIETWTRAHFEEPILIGPSILGTIAVVSDPAAIRRYLVENAANYRKDDLQKRVLNQGVSGGLLTAEGDEWRAQRRMLSPLFTPKTVASFAGAMVEAAQRLVARWRRMRDGRAFDVQPELARATLEVLGRTIFSGGLGRDPTDFVAPLTRYFRNIGTLDPFVLLDLPSWTPRFARPDSGAETAFIDRAVDEIIARRKKLVAEDPDQAPADLLTLLLKAEDPETGCGLSAEEVRANIATFIGAGHETTANALTWSLFLLSMSPQWRERLAAEADDVLSGEAETFAQRLIATRAVIEEAMRLYPPVASVSRQAIDFDTLAGRRIRRGAMVMTSQWVLHRHKLLWDEPDAFDPGRFMPGARDKIDRFAYLPLGAGPRVCIGGAFALQEAAILLAHIMREFALDVVKGRRVKPVQHITLRPEGGLPMILRRRR